MHIRKNVIPLEHGELENSVIFIAAFRISMVHQQSVKFVLRGGISLY